MYRAILLFSTFLISSSAAAEQHQVPPFSTDQVFSVATTDWNKDGVNDPVMILNVNEGERFDGLFYLSDEYGRLTLKHHIQDIVWGSSAMFGQEPSVTTAQNGSVILTSQNSAIGRNRWEQKLTIAYRNDKLVVAGFTYSYYDTLDPNAYGECDLNLLSGKGFKNEKPITFQPQTTSIISFSQQSGGLTNLCHEP